ncbi:MAG: 16S rRNA (guanine(966)-N(2))-methyltransferase RsmD [Nitrospirota bacterium]
MRISGGIAKGRRTATKKLFSKTFRGERLRPTTSKVREAIFDIIRNRIKGSVFVDLYAGTGTVGLEAFSRGAEKVIFVEEDNFRVDAIKKNIADLKFQERALVIKGTASEFIEKSSAKKNVFDILFIDPPYHSDEIGRILPMIGEGEILNDEGIVIVEHFFKRNMPETAGRLIIHRKYKYGDTILTIYRKVEK